MNEIVDVFYDLIKAEVKLHNIKHPKNKLSILNVIKHLELKNKKNL